MTRQRAANGGSCGSSIVRMVAA